MKKKALSFVHSIAGLFIRHFYFAALSFRVQHWFFSDGLDALQKPMLFPTKVRKTALTVDSGYQLVQQKYPHAVISNCDIAQNDHEVIFFFHL